MPQRNSLGVNAHWVTGSGGGGGSVVMSKQGLHDMEENWYFQSENTEKKFLKHETFSII